MSKIIGVNTRYFPAEMGTPGLNQFVESVMGQSMDPPPTVTVLVQGDIGDYAAYTGHGSEQWVAAYGDKISFAEACVHFPGGQLVEEKYRV